MCGILGYIRRVPIDQGRWSSANKLQVHRGPDSQATLEVERSSLHLGLGFQRLAILDLSTAGMQPMRLPGGSTLIFNGEIYNYVELKRELETYGVHFQGTSDTEVLLHLLSIEPEIQRTLSRLNGMWAFAWLDGRSNTLWLSRDRCGEKPLYYTNDQTGFYFASELTTLVHLRGSRFAVNKQVLGEYFNQFLIDASTETLFENIHQVAAGGTVRVRLDNWPLEPQVGRYWTLDFTEREDLDEAAFIEETRALFRDSVKMRLRSDVPVAILLSGGIDSSSIAAIAHDILGHNANLTFLSSVSIAAFDESAFVDVIEHHLGVVVDRVRLHSEDVFKELAQVTRYMDGPLGSLSNVAHFQLMQRAKELGVTVLLSGQGADEALCGYKKYLGFYIQSQLRAGHLAASARTLWDFWRNGSILRQFNLSEAKRYLPKWLNPYRNEFLGPALRETVHTVHIGLKPGQTVQERQIEDIIRFSVPALNHSEDRCSMAASREIRQPFLDWRLLTLFVSAPMELKLHRGWTKYGFRKAMETLLPAEIAWRKDKQGFPTPEVHWLKTDLKRGVLDDYFAPTSLVFRMGLVERAPLLEAYKRYCNHNSPFSFLNHREFFSVLACETWLRQNADVIVDA
ncbi:MAG: asparagine synthase (glutamine-hydrolyzing) [Methylocella sp.]